ncbi:MAG: hypothetical protein A2V63_12270 [Candidatus Eisenbacteria bacterium RBG_19FT_COMBO_70_11]|nr:MAG: hypothetical protein A2V63_12270 [Candidatus Eisenbacteria bacterium RBG_19FT_COMBO_70_11]
MRSKSVVPLIIEAPAPSRILKCWSSPMCPEPWNIMCSNRWAKPVRPAVSLAGPTWYQRLTPTIGSRVSRRRITSRPFLSVYFSNPRLTSGAFAPPAETAAAPEAGSSTTRVANAQRK